MRVLITDYQWADLTIEKRILGDVGAEIRLAEGTTEPELIDAATDCDAIMTCWAQTTASVIAAAQECQIVARMGIGLDNIDVEYCTAQGIPVTNVPDYCLIEVAEHALASVLSLARQISSFHLESKNGNYDLGGAPPIRRVQGQTIGIVGLGNIGSYLAQIAQGVGLKVIAHSRTPKDQPGVEDVSLEELLQRSDFISLHTPLTEGTKSMFRTPQFQKMKPTAFLINTARGGLIDHQDLALALEKNELAGAALDVQSPEPPDLSIPPYNHQRVIVTPHAAFVSEESLNDLRTRSAQQVADRISGKTPKHIVNGL